MSEELKSVDGYIGLDGLFVNRPSVPNSHWVDPQQWVKIAIYEEARADTLQSQLAQLQEKLAEREIENCVKLDWPKGSAWVKIIYFNDEDEDMVDGETIINRPKGTKP